MNIGITVEHNATMTIALTKKEIQKFKDILSILTEIESSDGTIKYTTNYLLIDNLKQAIQRFISKSCTDVKVNKIEL